MEIIYRFQDGKWEESICSRLCNHFRMIFKAKGKEEATFQETYAGIRVADRSEVSVRACNFLYYT